jgi:glycosyltransferase involved in cell wall biosynthesis
MQLHPWPPPPALSFERRALNKIRYTLGLPVNLPPPPPRPGEWLAKVIQTWQPDVIHTLGLDFASYFYLEARKRFDLANIGRWVVQVRGGPDLALHRYMPEYADKIRAVMQECDGLIADNASNYDYAVEMGLAPKKRSPLGVVPGTGGMHIEQLSQALSTLPSQRPRIILWPKAYNCPQSQAMPVFEAFKLAWERIEPCEVAMLCSGQSEIHMWFHTLPEKMQRDIHLYDRIPRTEVLDLMARSRVMLAPSMLDGVPNVLYEAMASGAFPIVSPLETITPLVKDEENVLFARNLYPHEITEALVRAMNDDQLVDAAAERNLELARRVADRAKIGPRVLAYYRGLAT